MFVLIVLAGLAISAAAQVAPADPNRWEPEIQKFEAEDKAKGLVKGATSSSAPRASRAGPISPNRFPIAKS